tara:strand:- start:627 stop:2372 length:1746 start_codon:yes stop_codon:yes gene_type:complete
MADVIITPASGLIDFQNTSGISSASIQLDGNGNLSITAAAGDIEIGDTASDIFVGDGVANVDIVFEEDGEIRGLAGKTITFGQSDSYLAFAGEVTGNVDFTGGLNVTGVTTFSGPISLGNTISLGDDDRLRFGDSQDFQIYHDGSNSFIRDQGTGEIRIETSALRVRNVTNGENIALFEADAGVKLLYDNSTKFQTTGAGVTVTGITSSTVLYAEGGTFNAGNDTETDAALVIREEGSIYTQDGENLRVLLEKKNDVIHLGQLGTTLIDGIHLRPGTTGGQVKLHAGGNSDAVKLETTGAGVTVTGICSASGGFDIGISSAGTSITSGPITSLNFIGAGNTFAVDGTTVDISIAGGGGASVEVGTSAPSSPSEGDLWYNSTLGRTFVYYNDGSSAQWVDASPFTPSNNTSVVVSSSAPTSPDDGQLWYNTTLARTFIYYNDGTSSQWVDSAPFNIPEVEEDTADGKTDTTITATEGQTTFNVAYQVGYVDVYLNGARLSQSEFTATNGTQIVLSTAASAGDLFDAVEYKKYVIGITTAQYDTLTYTKTLTIGTRSTNPGVIPLVGSGMTIALRSGIGTANF